MKKNKLVLKRETIRQLDTSELDGVAGGTATTAVACTVTGSPTTTAINCGFSRGCHPTTTAITCGGGPATTAITCH